ncbi:MAG: class I SAM-dependent methyltransferase [Nitrososphaerales archaeon]
MEQTVEEFYRRVLTNGLLNKEFDPIRYKEEVRKDWNEKACIYHEHYVAPRVGPFKSLEKLTEAAKLREGDRVLDIATGTGIVAIEALKKIGESGKVVGIDISSGALKIAKKELNNSHNVELLQMDAEDLKFPDQSFDVALSQFALFFFPDTQKALAEIKRVLVKNGRVAVSVHGSEENVPYFTSISSSILHHIPDIRPPGTPNPYRFGKCDVLKGELEKCNLKNIEIKSYIYTYNAGTFDDYWREFMRSTANAIRHRLESFDSLILDKIRIESKEKTEKFLRGNKIEFPWQVLVASATT